MKKLVLESMQKLDFFVWWLALAFFLGSSLIMWWNLTESFLWASWIIVLMFFVWFSIELVLASLRWVKWLWKITWFITNWPEALVLIVGLITWDILFAASTPLGSNLMNPVLLLSALIITGFLLKLKKFNHKTFFGIWFLISAIFAVSFFFIPQNYYILWIILALIISIILFTKKIEKSDEQDDDEEVVSKLYLPLWVIILLISWYFLDPVVSFTAEASMAPKWIIGFLVLATLTSWPEFKSVLWLLKRSKLTDAFENILVSNITNLWLAIIWVLIWLVIK